jgi:hypothetical protein
MAGQRTGTSSARVSVGYVAGQFTAQDAAMLLAMHAQWAGTFTITVENGTWYGLCSQTGEILDADSGPELKLKLGQYCREMRGYLRPVIQEDSASL